MAMYPPHEHYRRTAEAIAEAEAQEAAMTTPRIGDNVRIVDDRGTGTKGAIGAVANRYTTTTEPLNEKVAVVEVVVAGIGVHVYEAGVQVVHYDRDTRTWAEGRS